MENINLSDLINKAIPVIIDYGKMLIVAVLLLWIGWWLIKKIIATMHALFEKKQVDITLQKFFISLVDIALKALLVISVITYVGIPTTSFVAILGAAGLAVGMAFSGTLQNFAGGVMILVFRPFRIGDFIEAQGFTGTVQEIQIFNTIILTVDNKRIIIPNGGLSTGSLVNYSTMEKRRVDINFGISYSDNIDRAYEAIRNVIKRNQKILTDPAPFVGVIELADNSVNIVCRAWVKNEDYWDVFFYLNEYVKKEFDATGISIPFPQRDVHIIKD